MVCKDKWSFATPLIENYKYMESNKTMDNADSYVLNPISAEALHFHNMLKDRVIAEIEKEQQRQVNKFGLRDQSNGLWNAILVEEVGEVSKALLNIRFNNSSVKELREELIQVAAVAKSWIENLDIVADPALKVLFGVEENTKG